MPQHEALRPPLDRESATLRSPNQLSHPSSPRHDSRRYSWGVARAAQASDMQDESSVQAGTPYVTKWTDQTKDSLRSSYLPKVPE
jgi:hypothetical protein